MFKQVNQTPENINFLTITKGLLFSYVLTIPLFIILAFVLTYTSFPEKMIIPSVVLVTVISVITAASIVTRNAKSRGWLSGSFVGLLYIFVLYLASSILLANFKIDRYVITMFIIGILSGAIGGITGINTKKTSKVKSRNIR